MGRVSCRLPATLRQEEIRRQRDGHAVRLTVEDERIVSAAIEEYAALVESGARETPVIALFAAGNVGRDGVVARRPNRRRIAGEIIQADGLRKDRLKREIQGVGGAGHEVALDQSVDPAGFYLDPRRAPADDVCGEGEVLGIVRE